MSRTWEDNLKGETWNERADEMNKDISTNSIRSDLNVSLTDKEYSNLKLLTYRAGLESVGQLLSAFVGDLTGWHPNGSDEREIAQSWYDRAFGSSDFYAYFKHHLYDYDYDLIDMKEMLEDNDFFENVYEDFKAESGNKTIQSKEDCRAVLKQIIEEGKEL